MRALLDDYVTAPRAKVYANLKDFSFLDIITVNEDESAYQHVLVDPDAEAIDQALDDYFEV